METRDGSGVENSERNPPPQLFDAPNLEEFLSFESDLLTNQFARLRSSQQDWADASGSIEVPLQADVQTNAERQHGTLLRIRISEYVTVVRSEGSLLIRWSDVPEPDDPEDMPLHLSDLSNEELLDLQEQIGNGKNGLDEDLIQSHLKLVTKDDSLLENEPCCICQEEYNNGDGLGELNCVHKFHYNCIKQWLLQKNNCPLCKRTALQV